MGLTGLRRARLERGLTQLDVSLKTGIAPSRLSIIERGLKQATDDELARLRPLLEFGADELQADHGPHASDEEV